jgi:archaellum biogenesis ATPase FlaH
MSDQFKYVPAALRERPQWILWYTGERDGKPTKIPLSVVTGEPAKSNDPATWTTFEASVDAYDPGRHSGIGYVFTADDPFCGIDLDGCRDPKTGRIAEWAREIIVRLDSYTEVSPSGTGVKVFVRGVSPLDRGRKHDLEGEPAVCDKAPAVEVYDRLRYFAVTGLKMKVGQPEPADRTDVLAWLKGRFWPDEETRPPDAPPVDFHSPEAILGRARKYLAKLPAAVSGQSGHNATFHAACVLVLGFDLPEPDALGLMFEFNERCQPPWNERDLARKVREAGKQTGQRGYLKNAAPANWGRIPVPPYASRPDQDPPPGPKTTTLVDAARLYIESVRKGGDSLVSTSIPDLDYAFGGGVEYGEMVIFAARPSHGKSAVALQCLHGWTELGIPCAMVSEEMSALMLGKRTVQFASAVPQEHWKLRPDALAEDVDSYARLHAPCHVIENARTTANACAAIERRVREDGVKCVVVDYAQLLKSEGKSRYEQITNTSIELRQLASSCKIVLLVLCQLNRAVEQRNGSFQPIMSDLRDSGQLEQDADVISFLCWPHRIDQAQPREKYQFFIAKNRNRGTNQNMVNCRFLPDRQRFLDQLPGCEYDPEPPPTRPRPDSRRDRYGPVPD